MKEASRYGFRTKAHSNQDQSGTPDRGVISRLFGSRFDCQRKRERKKTTCAQSKRDLARLREIKAKPNLNSLANFHIRFD